MGFAEFLESAKRSAANQARLNGESVGQLLDQVQDHYAIADEAVRGILGNKFPVDEMALYFLEETLLRDFLRCAVQKGWVLFNFAEDNVVTRPIFGEYAVQYWFLRKEGVPYRLELMWLPAGGGFSPYHASLDSFARRHNSPALAHASFKALDGIEFGNAAFHLRQAGYEVLQHCDSTYGKFSYFRRDNDVPIKPRINVRDGGNGA